MAPWEDMLGIEEIIAEHFPWTPPTPEEIKQLQPGLKRFMRRARREGLVKPRGPFNEYDLQPRH